MRQKYIYEVDAPGGIDVLKTVRDPMVHEAEISFPGGLAREHIVGAREVARDRSLSDLIPNPFYQGGGT